MSKNFELLMEIERDYSRPAPAPDRPQESSATPTLSLATIDVCEVDLEVERLVKRVFLASSGAAHRQVVFCGIDAANPSSSVCARTALNLSMHTLEKVCLIDANPSSSGLTGQFEIPAGALSNRPGWGQCRPVASNLWLTGCSKPGGSGERANELRTKLTELRRDFGYVLIDAPGCAISEEAAMLGKVSDAVILVIEADETRRVAAGRAKENLEAAGVHLAGTVLNNRSFPIPRALYKRL